MAGIHTIIGEMCSCCASRRQQRGGGVVDSFVEKKFSVDQGSPSKANEATDSSSLNGVVLHVLEAEKDAQHVLYVRGCAVCYSSMGGV